MYSVFISIPFLSVFFASLFLSNPGQLLQSLHCPRQSPLFSPSLYFLPNLSAPSSFFPHSLSMSLSLCVYLSEQHKLGKLPGQHKAQIGYAQGDQGCPARAPCPEERGRKLCGCRGDKWRCIKTALKTHTSTHIQCHSECTTKPWLCSESASEIWHGVHSPLRRSHSLLAALT